MVLAFPGSSFLCAPTDRQVASSYPGWNEPADIPCCTYRNEKTTVCIYLYLFKSNYSSERPLSQNSLKQLPVSKNIRKLLQF